MSTTLKRVIQSAEEYEQLYYSDLAHFLSYHEAIETDYIENELSFWSNVIHDIENLNSFEEVHSHSGLNYPILKAASQAKNPYQIINSSKAKIAFLEGKKRLLYNKLDKTTENYFIDQTSAPQNLLFHLNRLLFVAILITEFHPNQVRLVQNFLTALKMIIDDKINKFPIDTDLISKLTNPVFQLIINKLDTPEYYEQNISGVVTNSKKIIQKGEVTTEITLTSDDFLNFVKTSATKPWNRDEALQKLQSWHEITERSHQVNSNVKPESYHLKSLLGKTNWTQLLQYLVHTVKVCNAKGIPNNKRLDEQRFFINLVRHALHIHGYLEKPPTIKETVIILKQTFGLIVKEDYVSKQSLNKYSPKHELPKATNI